MIDLKPEDVRWIVDPGHIHHYKTENVEAFMKWVEDWEYQTLPSGRYFTMKARGISFWGGQHQFCFGVESKDIAQIFTDRWGAWTNWDGKPSMTPAYIDEEGRFVRTSNPATFK